jgi:hypothetical protein
MDAWLCKWEVLPENQRDICSSSSQQNSWLLINSNSSNSSGFSLNILNNTSAVAEEIATEELTNKTHKVLQNNLITGLIIIWSQTQRANYEISYHKFTDVVFLIKFLLQNYPQLPVYICTQACQTVLHKTAAIGLSQLFGCALANIGKCLWLEHPHYSIFYLDYPPSISNTALVELIRHAPFKYSPLLAYKKACYYKPLLTHYPLPDKEGAQSLKLREDAVYLIIGGTGGIGKLLVQELVRLGAANIIVISRHAENAPDKIKNPVVHYYSLDVSNVEKVSTFFKKLMKEKALLKGIFYAAGNLNDKSFVTMSKADFADVWRVKSYGAWLFHHYSLAWRLDYFVLFSSISASIGQAMQINYSSANGFLDGLSYLRRAQGLASQSIQWSPWHALGMTHANDMINAYAKARGVELIEPEQGILAFRVTLNDSSPVLQVGNINWNLLNKTSVNKIWPACLYKALPELKRQSLEYEVINTIESYYSILSFQQLEIWQYLQHTKDPSPYHVFVGLQIDTALEPSRLKTALTALINAHELLRASFVSINDQPMLKINQCVKGHIDIIELPDEEALHFINGYYEAPFNLENAPLLKVGYLWNNKLKQYFLCFVIHHLICDGYSVKILLDQFIKLYNQEAIKANTELYSEYIAWQWDYYKSAAYLLSFNYWRQQIKPWYKHNKVNFPIPIGKVCKTAFDEIAIRALNNYARKIKAAPFYLIMACLIKVLGEFFNSATVSMVVFFRWT